MTRRCRVTEDIDAMQAREEHDDYVRGILDYLTDKAFLAYTSDNIADNAGALDAEQLAKEFLVDAGMNTDNDMDVDTLAEEIRERYHLLQT